MNAALNVRDYACAKVRRRMDSYLLGELSVDLSHEILEHLDRCPGCRAELQARESLRGAVRRLALATPGPREGFEAEVRARIAKTPRPAATGPLLLLAASLLTAAGLAAYLVTSRGAGGSAARAAEASAALNPAFAFAARNHRNCTEKYSWPAAAPPEAELAEGLDPELAAALRAACEQMAGYAPVAAHECDHAGEKVFHVIFRRAGSATPEGLVSVLATSPGSPLAPRTRLAGLVSGPRREGLAVVGGSARGGRLVFVVADLPDEAAMGLARSVLPALATAFVAR